MKSLLTTLLVLTFTVFQVSAQTIVGTDPENKNVVLEEFTGIYCVFCPQGHAIGQSIYDENPDDVVLVNVHTGSFAAPSGNDPDYRTPWGAALDGQSNLAGYPAATVNRHFFPGYTQNGGTAQGRNTWKTTSNQVLAEPSYLNVGVEATIVTSTRQLVVYVEVYYTGDSPENTNFLTVALLQNNIKGPQTGGGAGNNYNHMHMLRHFLTGQWGVEISETSTGSLYTGTFAYDLPEDYNDVAVVMEDLDVAAYVSETRQETISGNLAEITLVDSYDYDAAILSVNVPQSSCGGEFTPQVLMKNYGAEKLTSLEFEYSANGQEPMTYSWTGNLAQLETELVDLPTMTYPVTDNNYYGVDSKSPNGKADELPQNNNFSAKSPGSTSLPESCLLGIDIYSDPQGITWNIKDQDGEIVTEGGPYDNTGFNIAQIDFPLAGCYTFTLNDASGKGLGGGSYLITDMNTNILFTGDAFAYMAVAELAHDIIISVPEQANMVQDMNVFPNPASDYINVNFSTTKASDVQINIYDVVGKLVRSEKYSVNNTGSVQFKVETSGLDTGIYMVQLVVGNTIQTKKISIN